MDSMIQAMKDKAVSTKFESVYFKVRLHQNNRRYSSVALVPVVCDRGANGKSQTDQACSRRFEKEDGRIMKDS